MSGIERVKENCRYQEIIHSEIWIPIDLCLIQLQDKPVSFSSPRSGKTQTLGKKARPLGIVKYCPEILNTTFFNFFRVSVILYYSL